MRVNKLDDVVFGEGTPPPMPEPEPEIRRDSLGRPISQRALDALKAGQFRPGQSGNPGGSYKKRTVLDAAIRLMKARQFAAERQHRGLPEPAGRRLTRCGQRIPERVAGHRYSHSSVEPRSSRRDLESQAELRETQR